MNEVENFCNSDFKSFKQWQEEKHNWCNLLRESKRTARDVHVCDDCYHLILPGEKYTSTCMLVDWGMEEEKECEYCLETRKILADYNVYPNPGMVTIAWVWIWKRGRKK